MIPEAKNIITAFEAQTGCVVRCDVPAQSYSTFSVGGIISYLVEIENVESLQQGYNFLLGEGIRPKILGFGSNSVFPDTALDAWVFKLGKGFRELRQLDTCSYAIGAGSSLMTVSRKLSEQGLSGLEFAGGIPASFGGAVRMNAGAHGGEMAEVIEEVTFLDLSGELVTLSKEQLEFSYRNCSLPLGAIVTEVRCRFAEGTRERTMKARAKNLAYRKETQPLTLPSAGSTFRNPLDANGTIVPAGKLLEQAGMKGEKEGGAAVSTLHANWIVNPERRATSDDIWRLIKRCQMAVSKEFGIDIHPEVVDWS